MERDWLAKTELNNTDERTMLRRASTRLRSQRRVHFHLCRLAIRRDCSCDVGSFQTVHPIFRLALHTHRLLLAFGAAGSPRLAARLVVHVNFHSRMGWTGSRHAHGSSEDRRVALGSCQTAESTVRGGWFRPCRRGLCAMHGADGRCSEPAPGRAGRCYAVACSTFQPLAKTRMAAQVPMSSRSLVSRNQVDDRAQIL